MPKIHILEQDTINKIAAGEVIERPMAVVKELIENSIDAGANSVTAEIKDGGKSLIRLTDNGKGIPEDQIRLAFTPHATSKIDTADDLMQVSTLGFRGEALASIAAVSQLEMVTKTRDSLMGSRYLSDGGEEKAMEAVGCPEGTTILVRNLFYNTPARLKFLKTATTEAGYINTLMERLALSHPDITFRFIHQNQTKLQTSGNGNLKDVIYHIYGKDITANLLEIHAEKESCQVSGYIGKPVINRGNRNFMNYFINGRYIKSSTIHKAIEDAYQPYTMQHRYPFTVLHFTVDPEEIDINVHPQKMEIRFSNPQGIYQNVYQAVSEALKYKEFIPEVTFEKKEAHKDTAPKLRPAESFEIRRTAKEQGRSGTYDVQKEQGGSGHYPVQKEQGSPGRYGTHKERGGSINVLREVAGYHAARSADAADAGTREAAQSILSDQMSATEGASLSEGQSENQAGSVPGEKEMSGQNLKPLEQSERTQDEPGDALETAVPAETGEGYAGQTVPAETGEGYAGQTVPAETGEGYTGQTAPADTSDNVTHAEQIAGSLTSPEQETIFKQGILSEKDEKEIQIIGQVFDTFWILQYQDAMYMVDQHAAHEKVLYEQFMKKLGAKEVLTQLCQPPVILTLSIQEEEAVTAHQEVFEQLGYQIEHFGGREYAVTGVPAHLPSVGDEELLKEVIDTLVDTSGRSQDTPEILMDKIASMSCKAAVKGNSRLPYAQMEELLKELMGLENPYHCPHGRPTMIKFTKTELDKRFKRIV